MPNSMLDLDTNFPTFTEGQSTDAKLASVQNYLYMLVEQLRYSLRNLDLTNWNGSALDGFTGSITGPIYGRIEDGEGRMNRFEVDAEGLRGRLSDAEGNILSLTATAEGLKSSVSDAEGRLSVIEQTAKGLTSTVGELGGSCSQLQQTVDGFTFTDEDGKVWIDNGSLRLTGSISWEDLDSGAQNAITSQRTSLPNYIQSSYIGRTEIRSPTIYAADIYSGIGSSSYMHMGDDGLRVYVQDISIPKAVLGVMGNMYPVLMLGAGSDGYGKFNVFGISKDITQADIRYWGSDEYSYSEIAMGGTFINFHANKMDFSGVGQITGFTPKFT